MKASRKVSNEKLKSLFLYQEEGYLIRISGHYNGHKVGWLRADKKYIICSIDKKYFYVHRLIYQLHHGKAPEIVDHINRNSLDNRIENLREASHSENLWNIGLNKNNKSKYKGVHYCKTTNKFVAMIQINKKRKNLGLFKNAEEAYQAYCKASEKRGINFKGK